MLSNVKAKAKAAATVATVAPAAPVAVAPAPVAKPVSLRAESLAAHNAAGFTGATYGGLSKPRNSGVTKAPNTSTSKATARTVAQFTERMHKAMRELHTAYGAASFPLPGIDRGIAAIMLASGHFLAAGDARAKLSPAMLQHYAPAKAPKA